MYLPFLGIMSSSEIELNIFNEQIYLIYIHVIFLFFKRGYRYFKGDAYIYMD